MDRYDTSLKSQPALVVIAKRKATSHSSNFRGREKERAGRERESEREKETGQERWMLGGGTSRVQMQPSPKVKLAAEGGRQTHAGNDSDFRGEPLPIPPHSR